MYTYIHIYIYIYTSAITQTSLDLVNKHMCLRGSWGMSCFSFVVLLNEQVLWVPQKSCDDALAQHW